MKLKGVELPSNKKFGLFLVFIFGGIATYLYYLGKDTSAFLLFLLSFFTLLLAILKSEWLLPLNKLWMYFGFLLGKVISPIVLGMIFFLMITPIALAMRLVGRDELRLKLQDRETHWKKRIPIGPKSLSFKNQF